MIGHLEPKRILVGDDEDDVRDYLETTLRCSGYLVTTAVNGEEVLERVREESGICAVVLDIMMPGKDGLQTLQEMQLMRPDLPVIIVSGLSTPAKAVQAVKLGASDFLPKPVLPEDLRRSLKQALDTSREGSDDKPPAPDPDASQFFVGDAMEVKAIADTLPKLALSTCPVLILGETGVGKEVLARKIHALSGRANQPFVKLNCAAVPHDLLESELFGHERGAFTGAFQKKLGVLELANGGTFLLDEIGDMDMRLQAKLLQVLQDYEFRRVGGKELIRVNLRIIAATHRDLKTAIRTNQFREDLYFRLNVFTLRLPPLRERGHDILNIAEFMLRRHSTPDTPTITLSPKLKEALQNYDWPGNIRQLENVVRKLLILRDQEAVMRDLGVACLRDPAPDPPPDGLRRAERQVHKSGRGNILREVSNAKEQAEARAILEALNSTRWNRKEAAELLNTDYKALLYKMKKLSIAARAGNVQLP